MQKNPPNQINGFSALLAGGLVGYMLAQSVLNRRRKRLLNKDNNNENQLVESPPATPAPIKKNPAPIKKNPTPPPTPTPIKKNPVPPPTPTPIKFKPVPPSTPAPIKYRPVPHTQARTPINVILRKAMDSLEEEKLKIQQMQAQINKGFQDLKKKGENLNAAASLIEDEGSKVFQMHEDMQQQKSDLNKMISEIEKKGANLNMAASRIEEEGSKLAQIQDNIKKEKESVNDILNTIGTTNMNTTISKDNDEGSKIVQIQENIQKNKDDINVILDNIDEKEQTIQNSLQTTEESLGDFNNKKPLLLNNRSKSFYLKGNSRSPSELLKKEEDVSQILKNFITKSDSKQSIPDSKESIPNEIEALIKRFNADPKSTLSEENEALSNNPEDLLNFLIKYSDKLSPDVVSSFISSNKEIQPLVLNRLDTKSKTIVQSLHDLCQRFLFDYQAMYNQPLVTSFADHYLSQHSELGNENDPHVKTSVRVLFWHVFHLAEQVSQIHYEKGDHKIIPKAIWVDVVSESIRSNKDLTKEQIEEIYDSIVQPSNKTPIKFHYIDFKANKDEYDKLKKELSSIPDQPAPSELPKESTIKPETQAATQPAAQPVTQPETKPVTQLEIQPETKPETQPISDKSELKTVIDLKLDNILQNIEKSLDANQEAN